MNVLDLFSGIGGFSLGLEKAGMKTIAFCEINPFCRKVLRKHWPDVPVFDDIKAVDGVDADIICGGFPCQPFSSASRGRRVAEDLWPEMGRVVWRNMPKIVIAENVQEKPIESAARQLEMLGYTCTARNIGAAECGADHKRSRW